VRYGSASFAPNLGTQGLEAQQSQLKGVARARHIRVIFKAAVLEPLKRIVPSAAVAVAFHDNLGDRRSQNSGHCDSSSS
jgi:hypothetical protein